MPLVWNDKESGRAYISLPGDPRHPVRGTCWAARSGASSCETGRYRPVKAA